MLTADSNIVASVAGIAGFLGMGATCAGASVVTITGGSLVMDLDAAALADLNFGTGPSVPALVLEEFFDGPAAAARTRDQILFDDIVPGPTPIPATGLTYAVNGPSVSNLTDRFSQPTTFAYDGSDLLGTASGQIGLGGVMRFIGDFGVPPGDAVFVLGDFGIVYDAARATAGRSGWMIQNYFDFPATPVPVFDVTDPTLTPGASGFTLSGTLVLAPEMEFFFPGDALDVLGTFTLTAVPGPGPAALIGLCWPLAARRRRS